MNRITVMVLDLAVFVVGCGSGSEVSGSDGRSEPGVRGGFLKDKASSETGSPVTEE